MQQKILLMLSFIKFSSYVLCNPCVIQILSTKLKEEIANITENNQTCLTEINIYSNTEIANFKIKLDNKSITFKYFFFSFFFTYLILFSFLSGNNNEINVSNIQIEFANSQIFFYNILFAFNFSDIEIITSLVFPKIL